MKFMNSTLLGLFLLAVIFPVSAARAQESYTEDFTSTAFNDLANTTADWNTTDGELKLFPFLPTITGTCNTPGYPVDVTVAGDHAFVADGPTGLQVVDISDLLNPVIIGTCDTGFAYCVDVSGNHAFVADRDLGLQVIDISDPINPAIVGVCDTYDALGVAVSGDYAFVADRDSFHVIDIRYPTIPTIVGSCDTPYRAVSVAVAGDHAFVADGDSGLQVVDISDPTTPTIVGSCDTPDYAGDVYISGDHAFVADNLSGLQVIDISDPVNPTVAGSCATTDQALGVTVSGDHAYVGDRTSGLQVIDISDPSNPSIVKTCDTTDYADGLSVSGDHAFVADGLSGLQVIRISVPPQPVLVGSCNTHDSAEGVIVSGNLAFVADGESGLQVVDISDPTNPVLVGTCDTPDEALGVSVSGNHVFVADHFSGLQVVDISDPTTPTIVGSCDTPSRARGVTVAGDHAFVADGFAGLQVIDITDPENPVLLPNSFNTPDDSRNIVVAGNYAFVVEMSFGLKVYKIQFPEHPNLIGSFETPYLAMGLAVSGDHAFLASWGSGLEVIDISDPVNPTLVGNFPEPTVAWNVAVAGDYAFVDSGMNYGLQVIDISDPTNPTLMGTCSTPEYSSKGVVVSGDHVFLADDISGLQVIQVFQSEIAPDNNVGWSLPVDASNDMIPSVRLTTTQADYVDWELSADGGLNWQTVAPDGTWSQFTVTGSDLLWRSTHSWAAPGINPAVSNLTLEWLNENASVLSISDVPKDQGRQVSVEWFRSGHDFIGDVSQIVEYAVYRQIDPDLSMTVKTSLSPAVNGVSDAVRDHVQTMLTAGWDFVTIVPARAEDYYAVVVPTLADSTIANGQYLTTFMVSAMAATPGIFFDSQPDSGYSVDNLAPGVPTAIAASYWSGGVALDWEDAPETDFQHYRIYRDMNPGFEPSPANLVQEAAASGWTDPTSDPWAYHYKITALDYSGNEGEAGSPGIVSGVQDNVVPARTALLDAVPNPFNPLANLPFEMAAPGHARLKVYDTAGRLVATLLDEHCDAGRHTVTWNGRDAAGRMSSAGVYLYHLEVGDFIETKRMTLIK